MRNTLIWTTCVLTAAASFAHCERSDASAPQLSAAQRIRFDDAMQLFTERRYAGAYGRFASLADAGHVPSAQVALVMYRQGSRLFGSAWAASEPQLARWKALIGCEPAPRADE
jgi:hypothetical protein